MLNIQSHTGILIYVNNAPILWISKRQNTVESSSFGSELINLRIATEMVEALRYKLITLGITIDGPADIFLDNSLVVKNSSIPTSTLNKRHNETFYHQVREDQAAEIIWGGWIEGIRNLDDFFTEAIISIPKRKVIISKIFNNSADVVKLDGG